MPVLQCSYETQGGGKVGYIIPFSKISHISYLETAEGKAYYMHTLGGDKLVIGSEDYNKISDVMCKQEGVKK